MLSHHLILFCLHSILRQQFHKWSLGSLHKTGMVVTSDEELRFLEHNIAVFKLQHSNYIIWGHNLDDACIGTQKVTWNINDFSYLPSAQVVELTM